MDAADVLVQGLDKDVESRRDWVSSGQAKDYADYQRMCGEIHGLLLARQAMGTLRGRPTPERAGGCAQRRTDESSP